MDKTVAIGNLADGFIESVSNNPDGTALDFGDSQWSYKSLGKYVATITRSLEQKGDEPLIGLFAYRSVGAYAGILGILCSGKGYVPLNPNFPAERNAKILALSGCKTVLVDERCRGLMGDILDRVEVQEVIDLDRLQMEPALPLSAAQVNINRIAYVLFTSGSTGQPKGVPVSHKNVISYIETVHQMYKTDSRDRFSQFFELTFDPSVHDQFLCWKGASCLCVIPEGEVMAPAKFIKKSKVTAWCSVPSVGLFMDRMRLLKSNSFPDLRISIFCGEALPVSLVEKWTSAAPNSVVDNLYGPTEATITITGYRWKIEDSRASCLNGIVPIGKIFSGQKFRLIDDQFQDVEDSQQGELCLGGDQIVSGYYNNPEKTREQFIKFYDTGDELWYRTGDLVKINDNGVLNYLGRIDNQVQVRGYRVELQEVDHALRAASGTDLAITVAWPQTPGGADGLVGFVSRVGEGDQEKILAEMGKKLPAYMVPSRIVFIISLPLSSSGKIDRNELTRRLNNE